MNSTGGYLACIALVALPLLLLLLMWYATRRTPRPYPVCGHCEYPVQGTPTFICPECGSDLREVGIERFVVGNRKAMNLLSLIIALPLLVLVLLVLAVLLLMGLSLVANS